MAKFHSNDVSGEEKWTFSEIYSAALLHVREQQNKERGINIELYWYITWEKIETADFIFKDFGGETDVANARSFLPNSIRAGLLNIEKRSNIK